MKVLLDGFISEARNGKPNKDTGEVRQYLEFTERKPNGETSKFKASGMGIDLSKLPDFKCHWEMEVEGFTFDKSLVLNVVSIKPTALPNPTKGE